MNMKVHSGLQLTISTIELFITGGVGQVNGNWYNAIKNRHQLWPGGRIPYTISSQYTSYSRSLIAASMQEYSDHTCVHWAPKTTDDVNYVYIFPDRGCYSMVGKIVQYGHVIPKMQEQNAFGLVLIITNLLDDQVTNSFQVT
ncbi:Zinc metalloproteinase nas-15 [Parelaphostrongylus tenuis]|uniref:Zinc metalloproteinase nas-15 n=1 Tax=Parelaphostrongylus tenuis TaxID=148309 RepID=A0AAD5R8V2_PARTN|nr:Zinc metalloproteinase nas-15 [Parelaphostrongylus tenuis]